MQRLGITVATAAFILWSTVSALAQVKPAEVRGRVTDAAGAGLSGVTVTVVGAQATPVKTDIRGDYHISLAASGTVTLSFALPGYRSESRQSVLAENGSRVAVNVALARFSSLGEALDRATLDKLPFALDPIAVAAHVPGVVTSTGVNVGGSATGQQLALDSRSVSSKGVTWTLDGAVVTDPVAIGSPQYYDFGSFDSIQVVTGGADASLQTVGPTIQLTTRSGGSTFGGSFRAFGSNHNFESSNVTPQLFTQGAGAGVPLTSLQEYGAEAGGPIARHRAWWWIGADQQTINGTTIGFYQVTPGCPPSGATFDMLSQLQSCLAPDRATLTNVNGNAIVALSSAHQIRVDAGAADKTRNARQASSLTAIESTIRQTGTAPRVSFRDAWMASPRFALTTQVSYLDNRFNLGFQTPGLADTQVFVDLTTGATSRSLIDAQTIRRPVFDVRSDGLFAVGSSHHALKFGISYRRAPTSTYVHTGGDVVARYRGATPDSAVLYRDGDLGVLYDDVGVYAQDTWTLGRLVLTGGARFDLQDDFASAGSVPANSLDPGVLGAATFRGVDPPVAFKNIAPRVAASYSLNRSGSSVISGSFSEYFGQGIDLARAASQLAVVTAVVPWSDTNHDRIVQAGEIPVVALAGAFSGNLDTVTGLSYPTQGPADQHLQNSRTRETIVSFDQQIGPDVTVSAGYTGRLFDRDIWTPHQGDSSSNYTVHSITDSVTGLTATYYLLNVSSLSLGSVYETNQGGRHTNYNGFDLALRKRMSHRWMFDAALTLQSSIDHYPAGSYTDPTNINMLDGQPADVYLPRYVVKLDGRIELPRGFGVSAVANIQDGFIRDLVINGPSSRGALPFTTLLVAPQGTSRYPAITTVDAQIDKSIHISGRSSLTLNAAVFNLLNSSTVFSQVDNQSLTTFGTVLGMLGPRVARFGATFSF